MSDLYLIRHGQASFGAANYDVLSELGVRQSAELGKYTAQRPLHFDSIYTGPLKRQVDTASHMVNEAKRHGHSHPQVRVLDELSEYPAFELIDYFLPRVREQDAELAAAMAADAGPRTMDMVMKTVLTRWATGELVCDELESFAAFEARVLRGLRHLMSTEGRGRTVAVVTSGGPISVAMKYSLELPAHQTMRIGWTVANSSFTRFRFRGDELTLHSFNTVAHLARDAITYR